MPSLNPALEDVRFCPRCAAEALVTFPRSLQCDACGYRALWSPEPVAATIPRDADGRIWLLRRALHEGAGRWTFPGGFVELGETVEDAARRETREELDMEIELGELVGVYSRADVRVVLVVFDGARARRRQRDRRGDRGAGLRPRGDPLGRARVLVDDGGAARRPAVASRLTAAERPTQPARPGAWGSAASCPAPSRSSRGARGR